ncbi:MAG: SURF1 family protein [Rhodospirillales bacterium]|nr:SURF1 family protein [Rhodospirillales bacterium]MDE2197924.1 SURF1 family protein [Rhodospirillales bacterium]MDE2574004.1 SURF1 family protein [Rhodospirillales bacterium]
MKRLLVPALSTVVMLAILLALGFWQVERLHWKEGLLAAIARAERQAPVPLPPHPSQFIKVAVTGRLRADLAVRYGDEVHEGPGGPRMGAQLLVPLLRAAGAPVLVDLGWLPDGVPPRLAQGEVTVQGWVREGERPGLFSAHDDAPGRHFYTLDPPAIGAALGVANLADFTLIAMGPPPAQAGVPLPAAHLPRPPNNHLQYALTWFGFALTLLVIFALYARKVLRS